MRSHQINQEWVLRAAGMDGSGPHSQRRDVLELDTIKTASAACPFPNASSLERPGSRSAPQSGGEEVSRSQF